MKINEEKIIESNKLIAEFMGGKYDKDVSFPIHPDDIWLPFHGVINCKTIKIGKGQILSYHDSWEWLMPVLEKIVRTRIGDGIIYVDFPYLRTFGMINIETGKIMVRFNGQTLFESNTLIGATYLAVVDFINWHNLTFNQNGTRKTNSN